MVIVIIYCNYLEVMYTRQNTLSIFSQSGTHSRPVWLMYLVKVKSTNGEESRCNKGQV